MREGGLEPPPLAGHARQTCVSAIAPLAHTLAVPGTAVPGSKPMEAEPGTAVPGTGKQEFYLKISGIARIFLGQLANFVSNLRFYLHPILTSCWRSFFLSF